MRVVDRSRAASSFLQFRSVVEPDLAFDASSHPQLDLFDGDREPVYGVDDIEARVADSVRTALAAGPTGIMLSGGIDSMIVASFLPAGTPAYTFRLAGTTVRDESDLAARTADRFDLDHRIVEVGWDDYLAATPALLRRKHAPFHSIEAQIHTAALRARADGIENLLFGENSDIAFGGFDGLLGRDWTLEEFVLRYSQLDPRDVLADGVLVTEPFERHRVGTSIDVHAFINDVFFREANGSYTNSCDAAGVTYVSPFQSMVMGTPLDLERVRHGEPKYLMRELYRRRFETSAMPEKFPMARGVAQWLADWGGPRRPEFLPGCAHGRSGDQRWQIWILEQFLDALDAGQLQL